MPGNGNGSRHERALAEWLEELPAIAATLQAAPDARRVVLEDALGDQELLAAAPGAHPVLRARAHLAFGTIALVLASDGGDAAMAERGLDQVEAGIDVARTLRASGPRLSLLSQAGALAAMGAPFVLHTRRRAVTRHLADVAEEIARAFEEQAADAHRGTTTLAGAAALADGAEAVTGRARDAVLRKALEMAKDARRDLIRAGELQRAALASDAIAALEAVVK
jgi:hypothetical protein